MDGKPIQFRRLVEIFGFLGVIASLVFVALEIRQNTRAVYGATIQGMAEQSFETSMVIVQTPDLRTAYLSMYDDDIGADKRLILAAFYTGITRVLENRFVQSKLGLIEYEDLERFGAKARDWRQPYFRDFWALRKDNYTIDFQEYVEREILSQTTVDGILDNPEPVNK